MKYILWAVTAAMLLPLPVATAGIIEDFQFGEDAGTAMDGLVSSAASGQSWGSLSGLDAVATNGLGQLDASLKADTSFGRAIVDVPRREGGPLYAVLELTFDFDPATLDTAENEEIRLSLLNGGLSTVTAEVRFDRTDDNVVALYGTAIGDGAVATDVLTLGLSQPTTAVAVLALHLGADTMAVHYSSDAGASFTTAADLAGQTAALDPARGVERIRLVLNNDLSQDNVLIDRLYLTDENPFPGLIPDAVPEPASVAIALCSLAACRLARRRV